MRCGGTQLDADRERERSEPHTLDLAVANAAFEPMCIYATNVVCFGLQCRHNLAVVCLGFTFFRYGFFGSKIAKKKNVRCDAVEVMRRSQRPQSKTNRANQILYRAQYSLEWLSPIHFFVLHTSVINNFCAHFLYMHTYSIDSHIQLTFCRCSQIWFALCSRSARW